MAWRRQSGGEAVGEVQQGAKLRAAMVQRTASGALPGPGTGRRWRTAVSDVWRRVEVRSGVSPDPDRGARGTREWGSPRSRLDREWGKWGDGGLGLAGVRG